MRHSIFTFGAMLAATFALSSCDDSVAIEQTPSKGVPFEISTLLTKTTNDGLATNWAADDAINLFHAEADSTSYTSDGKFTVDEALTGKFSGTLAKALEEGKSYDWYAFYPYSSHITTPANTSGYPYIGGRSDTPQTQTGNGSKAHLSGTACPLYGVVKDVASDVKPAIAMKHAASVVAIKVTNTLAEELTVNSISFTSTENIVGQFYIDFSSDTAKYKDGPYVSSTANLTVTGGEAIAQNASAVFYIAVKPHTAASGSTLKISVNGAEKTLTLPKAITFTAGSIKTLAYEYEGSKVSGQALPFEEDFSSYVYSDKTKDQKVSVSEYINFTSFNDYVYGSDANGVLRLGNSSKAGSMVTVPLDLSSESTVIVKAKKYGSDNTAVRITINGENYDTDKLSADYKEYYIYLPAINNYASVTVTGDVQKRYYIDDIRIVSGKVTPPSPPVIAPASTSATLEYDDEDVNEMDVTVTGQEGDVSCGVYDDAEGVTECSWCTAEYAEGKVSYYAEKNTGSVARTAYIILSATNSDGTTQSVITLIQNAQSLSTEVVATGTLSSTSKESTLEVGKAITYSISGTNTYSNPARFYQGYTFTVSCSSGNIKKIEIVCDKESYAEVLSTTMSNSKLGTVTTASDKLTVSIVLTKPSSSIKFTNSGQWRAYTMTVTYDVTE